MAWKDDSRNTIARDSNILEVYIRPGGTPYYASGEVGADTHIVSITWDLSDTEPTLWVDGALQSGTDVATTSSVQAAKLGARQDGAAEWEGDIFKFIIYQSELSTADRQSVESYLNTKYGGIY